MTFPIYSLAETDRRIRQYIDEDRPLNMMEIQHIYDIVDPLYKAAKRIVTNIPDSKIPGNIFNDWLNLKQLLG